MSCNYPVLTEVLSDTAHEVEATKKSVPQDLKEWVMRLKDFVEQNSSLPISVKIEYPASQDKDQHGATLTVRPKDEDAEKEPLNWYFLKEGDKYYLSKDEGSTDSPYVLSDSLKKEALREKPEFNEKIAQQYMAEHGYAKRILPPLEKMLPQFVERANQEKPNETDYFTPVTKRAEELQKDVLKLIDLIKDPDVHQAMANIKTHWGESALMKALQSAITTPNGYDYKNRPENYIPLESVPLPKDINVDVSEYMETGDPDDKYLRSKDWLKSLPAEDHDKVKKALPKNVKVDWDKGEAVKVFPNKFATGEVFFNKKKILDLSEESTKSKDMTPELQDLIVERLEKWIESTKESEEDYRNSAEGMEGYEVHIDSLSDAVEQCSDRVQEAVQKLEDNGVDEDVILNMLTENADEVFESSQRYQDNELGRYATDGDEELYIESDTDMSDELAKDLPTANIYELLNLLDDEHLAEIDKEYGVRGERGDRTFETIYCYPGYRAMTLILRENDFLKAFRRMQKDVRMFEKQGAPKEEIHTMLLARFGKVKYPTLSAVLSKTKI
jgi:hypothetical protein